MVREISVVICAYTEKRWEELTAAIASVQDQTLSPREIVLVIDHNPSLLSRVQENFSGLIVVENGEDKGLSGARNSGWSVAQGEIIAFLDDDATAESNWLENLAVCYADPEVAGVGGKIIPLWKGGRPFWFPEEFNWVVGCTYRGMPVKNARIRNVIGANMSIRRDILTAVGGFRAALGWTKDANDSQLTRKWFNPPIGNEETEICIRVSQQLPDSIWLYTALAVVQHHVPVERTRWKYFLWRCYTEGLGKARLVKLHNASKGLSSERTYTFKVLPGGVASGLIDAFGHFKLAGICSAGAIMAGFTMTSIGYLTGLFSSRVTGFKQVSIPPVRASASFESENVSTY